MWQNFKNCFIKDNPVYGLFLGMCSTLAMSASLDTAIGMGMCVTLVLIFSNAIISAIRKITPSEIRIPVYIVIIASLVTVVEMLSHAFMPELYSSLGAFLSLIVVNCIILGRAESFASKNPILPSIVDGLGMGLGYTFALVITAIVREFLSTGGLVFHNPFNSAQTIFNLTIGALDNYTISLFSSSVGAFLTFAIFAALFTWIKNRQPKKKEEAK